jgi:hypothetical protein
MNYGYKFKGENKMNEYQKQKIEKVCRNWENRVVKVFSEKKQINIFKQKSGSFTKTSDLYHHLSDDIKQVPELENILKEKYNAKLAIVDGSFVVTEAN